MMNKLLIFTYDKDIITRRGDDMYQDPENKRYIAVIGDIKKSKQSNDRSELQKRLKAVLADINLQYRSDIASKFVITLGDEFQGLLQRGEHIMDILSVIELRMHPIEIRFGIGIGKITTEINPEMSLGADGPAYYYAREAVTKLKEREKKSKSAITDVLITTGLKEDLSVMLLNALLSLLTVMKQGWTDRQYEVILDYLQHGDNQAGVAGRLGITQSSVQKSLSNANFYSYKEAVDTISTTFLKLWGDVDD